MWVLMQYLYKFIKKPESTICVDRLSTCAARGAGCQCPSHDEHEDCTPFSLGAAGNEWAKNEYYVHRSLECQGRFLYFNLSGQVRQFAEGE